MGTPYIGEIRIFAGNFAPNGWSFCDGSLIPISENDALFNLIGTTYGGDGQTTFALPDLRSRVPVHQGPGFALAQSGGVEQVTLTTNQIPSHSHVPQAAAGGSGNPANSPANNVWNGWTGGQFTPPQTPGVAMSPAALQLDGGSQPHDNMVPFLTLNFIISLFGVFPTPT